MDIEDGQLAILASRDHEAVVERETDGGEGQ